MPHLSRSELRYEISAIVQMALQRREERAAAEMRMNAAVAIGAALLLAVAWLIRNAHL